MKTKQQPQSCRNCKSRTGASCKKTGEAVALGDWCGAWKLATRTWCNGGVL